VSLSSISRVVWAVPASLSVSDTGPSLPVDRQTLCDPGNFWALLPFSDNVCVYSPNTEIRNWFGRSNLERFPQSWQHAPGIASIGGGIQTEFGNRRKHRHNDCSGEAGRVTRQDTLVKPHGKASSTWRAETRLNSASGQNGSESFCISACSLHSSIITTQTKQRCGNLEAGLMN
jgi:hypothetical protein